MFHNASVLTSAAVVGQVWRDGSQQANLPATKER